MIKISIITVCKNSSRTIEQTLHSVANQNYKNIEHIVKDGCSTDSTVKLVNNYRSSIIKFISREDRGIYDAMNQALEYATGDVVAFLNSDDYYHSNDVIFHIMESFNDEGIDYVYGNARIINSKGNIVRSWDMCSHDSTMKHMKQIAHPAFFIRHKYLKKITPSFDISYKIAADLKQQLTFLHKFNLNGKYLNKDIVVIRTGGASTKNIFSYISGWLESSRAYAEVFDKKSLYYVLKKVSLKILQVI